LLQWSTKEGRTYTEQLLKDVTDLEGVVYVAEEDGQIKGFIQGIVARHASDSLYALSHVAGDHAWIGELYVQPEIRAQGIGKILVEKIGEYFKTKGCVSCRLSVIASNKRAITFYENIGFKIRDLEMTIDL
jgi:ribosomal protein S18 acetylase RimI-like enzyme